MSKLTSNVYVTDPDTGVGTWYGPDYPDAGDPPEGAVTNPAAFEPQPHEVDLRFRADDFAGSDDDPRAVLHPEEATTEDTEDTTVAAVTAPAERAKPARRTASR